MKKISQFSVAAIFVFAIIIIPSCGGKEQSKSDEVVTEINVENITSVDYAVEGMVCAMGCAATIQKELVGMEGVQNCEVDFEAGKAHVEFDKTVLSESDVISKIESIADGQYKVSQWSESENEIEDEEEEEGGASNTETEVEVSLPSFEIPNLLTLLIDQI